MRINESTNRVFVVTYANNSVVVLNGATDEILGIKPTGGFGAWGLAINPTLNRLYVSHHNSGTVTTLDGSADFQVIASQSILPCGGSGTSPYGLSFNPGNAKLYVACSLSGNVNSAAIYQAGSGGLTRLAFLGIGDGGDDGGGGLAVNSATGNVFITNSVANNVSVIGGASDRVLMTIPVGYNPFGDGVDPSTGQRVRRQPKQRRRDGVQGTVGAVKARFGEPAYADQRSHRPHLCGTARQRGLARAWYK